MSNITITPESAATIVELLIDKCNDLQTQLATEKERVAKLINLTDQQNSWAQTDADVIDALRSNQILPVPPDAQLTEQEAKDALEMLSDKPTTEPELLYTTKSGFEIRKGIKIRGKYWDPEFWFMPESITGDKLFGTSFFNVANNCYTAESDWQLYDKPKPQPIYPPLPEGCEIPEGWRQRAIGETVKAGDQFWEPLFDKWIQVKLSMGKQVNDGIYITSC